MATYYVDMAVGGDGNLGTSEGAGNAWQTIDHAMNTVVAGDKVWVKASANYTELVTIDALGAQAAPIVFEGYTAATGDGGRATIDGGAARVNCVLRSAGGNLYYVFKNFRMTDATGDGCKLNGNHVTFKNCKFDTNGGDGLEAYIVLCQDCEFVSNTGSGANKIQGGGAFVGCTFYSNGLHGFSAWSYPFVALFCTFFSNAGKAIYGGGAADVCVVANCTIDGDGKDSDAGIRMDLTLHDLVVVNTVMYDCTVGLTNSTGNMGERVVSKNNAVNNNTADYNNADTFTGEVVAAPTFVNEVGGADYTPDTGSPLIEAGADIAGDMDIGAIQKPGGGGGGGMLVHPGTSGGARG